MSIILWPRKWVHFLTENTSTAKCNREFADGGHAVANCGVERNILCQRSLTSPGEWMCSPDSTMDLSGLPRRHLGVSATCAQQRSGAGVGEASGTSRNSKHPAKRGLGFVSILWPLFWVRAIVINTSRLQIETVFWCVF